jgi:stonin-1/2
MVSYSRSLHTFLQFNIILNFKGMPDLELGVNDINRQGKEVVGRHDIIPVKTEEWIRLEGLEFHSCVLNSDYEGDKVIK